MMPIDEALEAEYALRRRHPERGEVYADFSRRSAAYRAAAPCTLDIRYAQGPRCLLDVFPAAPGAPVFLFIHGGYWRALDKETFSFLAAPYQAAGISVVMPTYDLAPAVSVTQILGQMREALAWITAELAPPRIVVCGHSAGGQLAAMLALDQIEAGDGPIAGLVPISGALDLRPLRQTSINADVRLSAEETIAMSPSLRVQALPEKASLMPLVAIVGGGETRGFKDWTNDFAELWRERHAETAVVEPAGLTHFTILEPLADSGGDVTKRIIELAR